LSVLVHKLDQVLVSNSGCSYHGAASSQMTGSA
jgi:hypothetical protein